MICKPVKFRFNGRVWYYQTFTPERCDPELAIRLYDEDGEFVREFSSFPEMKKWLSENSKKNNRPIEMLRQCVEKMIEGKKVHRKQLPVASVRECIRVYNEICKHGNPVFINSDVKEILDKCGVKTKEYGVGWIVTGD